MNMLLRSKWKAVIATLFIAYCAMSHVVFAFDRVELVTEQIKLLKHRYEQTQQQLYQLQQEDLSITPSAIQHANKSLLEKAKLDISVAKSNLDSVSNELTDTQQTISWLEKNTQDLTNQLNVLGIFGLKNSPNERGNIQALHQDLAYSQKLLRMEKIRLTYLQDMQTAAKNMLELKKDKHEQLALSLKSQNLVYIKQQQVKDELEFQEQQNSWLQELNVLYARIALIDPAKNKNAYADVERDIFYANENASYAYVRSLLARYDDQLEQMKLALLKSNSISLLNEIGDQVQGLLKQVKRLDNVLKTRTTVLEKHITYLSPRKGDEQINVYLDKLQLLKNQYQTSDAVLIKLNKNISTFRVALDQDLQSELSSRQGLPSFSTRMMLDLGKELLLVPALTYQIVKSLTTYLFKEWQMTHLFMWCVYACIESVFIAGLWASRRWVFGLLNKPSVWQEQLNSKWLGLMWLKDSLVDLFVITNMMVMLLLFGVPFQNVMFVMQLAAVWIIIKSILLVSRVCLKENTLETDGRDMRLYNRLKWVVLVGGVITATTVFMHQLPLIYELKALSDRLFLLFLLVVSGFLLRSRDVVPNLIISQMDYSSRYFVRSVRFLGTLLPLVMFGNSLLGLFGFLNLVMTVSWYEGLFILVLMGYLALRGLLSAGFDALSRLTIQYAANGWLLNEAFLKPLDKLLRIALFLAGWAVLFLLFGWDNQSPIVVRLAGLLHYRLASVLGTTITPLNLFEFFVAASVFYWVARWTREFVYRLLALRTADMGIRNSIAIISQYAVVLLGGFFCLRLFGIDLSAFAVVASFFSLGIGLGLKDLVNNFACGFLILLERPLRVGDIVDINGAEGEVTHIGSRAVTVRTWDRMDLVVPNTEIFNKTFTNWTGKDNLVRTSVRIVISRYDNPHQVSSIIKNVLLQHKDVLKDPVSEVYMKEMSDKFVEFELRYFVNVRQVKSRTSVKSSILMTIWDEFALHGIQPPMQSQEIVIKRETPTIEYRPSSGTA
jgi:potassium efflux system protein